MTLDALRQRIDQLDEQLVRLLNERTSAAMEIGRVKQANGQEIYVPAREKAVLDRVFRLNQGPLAADSLNAIYREIMSAALALEHDLKIAYLGPQATFTHQAARARFGASVTYIACQTISDVFQSVQKRETDYGVVPIENSTEGAVTHTLDEFFNTPLKICAEIYLRISHHLMATGPLDQVKRLYSNPQVFGQCRRWLLDHLPQVDLVPVSSTARAAEMAVQEPESGALASTLAAELYGLNLLHRDLQDISGNTTRFLVVGPQYGAATGTDKTSVFFTVKHKAGALCAALDVLRRNGLNMTKIESRPSKARPWEYVFFVDLEGHAADAPVAKALDELNEHCALVTILGAYPQAQSG